jgi:glycosyltransferase involved in cell wall biosynthesis
LAYHREADLLQRAMVRAASRAKCEFWMFGSTEQEAQAWFAPLRAAGVDCVAVPMLGYQDYLEKVAEAAIGLQPVCTETDFCKGKSFGKVLAYLSGAAAVVATDAVDHALALKSGRDAMLVENDPNIWGDTIAELVLDVSRRSDIAENGRMVFDSRFTMDEYARRVDKVLRSVTKSG